MPEKTPDKAEGRKAEHPPSRRPPIPTWKRALLIASVALSVLGLGLMGYAALTSPQRATNEVAPDANSPKPPPLGFLPTDSGTQPTQGQPQEAPPRPVDTWSPVIFRTGFSFFVGFAIAYALRTFVRISLVVVGVLALALFGLQYAGVISVDWSAMGQHYHSIVTWIGDQASSMQRFITGYLPSAASATAGLVLGFRRK